MLRRIAKKVRRTFAGKSNAQFQASSRDDLVEVFSDDLVRVTALGDLNCPNIFLCFTGVKQGMGGIGAEEFVGSTRMPDFCALFVSDLKRSWFNSFPESHLVEAIGDIVEGKRIVTVGNSMGGYGAIWATKPFPVETAIAFAPQFSVHPDVVSEETRWEEWRRDISIWRHRSLETYFNDETKYFTFNGDDDALHWSHFPTKPNTEHFLLPNSGHAPAAMLKDAGVLTATIESCVAGVSPMEILQHHIPGIRYL